MLGLLIAEKNSQLAKIEAVYKKNRGKIPYDIIFTAQAGHLLGLKSPDELSEDLTKWSWDTLPIEPESYGGFQYKFNKAVKGFESPKDKYKKIKDALNEGVDFIIHAGDPDQEGELLVDETIKKLNTNLPVKRFWTNDLTDGKILEALLNLRDDDHEPMLVNLKKAGYCRQHSDYRIGMNASRAASMKMNCRVSVGRVKTVILSIVCKREEEIKNFKPTTTYSLKSIFKDQGFSGTLLDKDATAESIDLLPEKWFETEDMAKKLGQTLPNTGEVVFYSKTKKNTYAPKLYKLVTIQVAAGKYGFSPDETLATIQSLYDKGYMSYPRTDCEVISSHEDFNALIQSASCVPELSSYASNINQQDIENVKSSKKYIDDAKLAEAGHSALTPTTKRPNFDELSEQQKIIYTLVAKRFLAIFMPPMVHDEVKAVIKVGDELFRSTGKTLLSPGFSVLFGVEQKENILPPMKKGDRKEIQKMEITSKTTQCPKRFTQTDLIAVCEAPHKYLNDQSLKTLGKKLFIGTPATRADILSGLIHHDKYLKETKKILTPTETGQLIYDNLKDSDVCKVDMTGQWEVKLNMVRSGELSYEEFEEQMRQYTRNIVEFIKTKDMAIVMHNKNSNYVELDDATCPLCRGKIIVGPKGFFCSNVKNNSDVSKKCKFGYFKELYGHKLTDNEIRRLVKKEEVECNLKAKTGSKYKGTLFYNFDSMKVELKPFESSTSSYSCPFCHEQMKESNKMIYCQCGCKIWKEMSGHKFTKEEIEQLIDHKMTSEITFFSSKKKKNFNAAIIFKDKVSSFNF